MSGVSPSMLRQRKTWVRHVTFWRSQWPNLVRSGGESRPLHPRELRCHHGSCGIGWRSSSYLLDDIIGWYHWMICLDDMVGCFFQRGKMPAKGTLTWVLWKLTWLKCCSKNLVLPVRDCFGCFLIARGSTSWFLSGTFEPVKHKSSGWRFYEIEWEFVMMEVKLLESWSHWSYLLVNM